MKSDEDESELPPEGAALSRREVQCYLKGWGRRAVGTTEELREAYDKARMEFTTKSDQSATSTGGKKRADKKEERAKLFRSSCSKSCRDRIQRAKTQRLYLVNREVIQESKECKFVVLGSTGNVYNVFIRQIPACTCPDHERGNLCKHILFVLLKVMGIDSDSFLIYQAAYLESELEEMFEKMNRRRVGGAVMANEKVQAKYASLQRGEAAEVGEEEEGGVARKALDAEDNACPICFDSMDDESGLTHCRAACGMNFHAECIRRWIAQQRGAPTCPNCRQPWVDNKKRESEGYTNLGKLQGQPSRRDTSTYYGSKRGRYY